MKMLMMSARCAIALIAATVASRALAQSPPSLQWSPITAVSTQGALAGVEAYAANAGQACCDQRGCEHYYQGCACPACRRWIAWVSADFLLGWGKGRRVPALVTTSPPGTPQADAGVLGRPATTILFGNGDIGDGSQGGARLDFGTWFDDFESLGAGATVWGFAGDIVGYGNSSDGSTIIARPFFAVDTATQDAFLVAYPGVSRGSISIRATNDILGTDAYLRTNVWVGRGFSVDAFGGYEFMRIDDDLSIQSSSTILGGGGFPVGTTLDILDNFDARNEFHGGVIGVVGDFHYRRLTVSLLAKLAVGNMNQRVTISGRTVVDTGGGPVTSNNGLLTQASNIGTYSRNKTAYIPEFGVTAAYSVNDYLALNVGYRFTWWSNVALATDAVNLNVDQTQVTPNPSFQFRNAEYYMHALSVGATVRW